MGIVCFRLSTMKTIIILIVASLAFAEDYDYPTVDENCSDPCCTLQVTRPDDENVEKYSGVYKKKGGHKDENGGVNGYPKYVKQGTNGTVWMQVSIGYGSDYEDFPNWGIMDDNRRYGLDWPAVKEDGRETVQWGIGLTVERQPASSTTRRKLSAGSSATSTSQERTAFTTN